MAPTWLVRRAWMVLLAIGLFEGAFGLTLLLVGAGGVGSVTEEIRGAPWQEIATSSTEVGLIDYFARGWGQANLLAAIFIVAITAVPLRRGERWGWLCLWAFPASLLVTVVRNLAIGITSVAIMDGAETIAFAAALLLSYQTLRKPGESGR